MRIVDQVYRAAPGCDEDRHDESGVQSEPVPIFGEYRIIGTEKPLIAWKQAIAEL